MGALQLAPRHLDKLRALLAQYVPQADVWAYGSRVMGGSHEGSDLDLVLLNPADLAQPGAPAAAMSGLIEALQAGDLPMLVQVHDWSQLPAAFRTRIQQGHVVVQAARSKSLARA